MSGSPVDAGLGYSSGRRVLKVRMASDPASVPGARKFVRDGLTAWGRRGIADDAALCVTELTSNAALHSGSRYVDIAVHELADVVRISVQDAGTVPTAAVVPSVGSPVRRDGASAQTGSLEDEPTTGRGLLIVSRLAHAWGVDDTPAGKVVWAELASGAPSARHEPEPWPTPRGDGASRHSVWMPSPGLPEDWHCVVLAQCPVGPALRMDQHLDELIRELQLLDADPDVVPSRELARVMSTMLDRVAHARHTARLVAQDAAAAGLSHISIEIPMPVEQAVEIKKLDAVVAAADLLAERQQLLTLASTPQSRSLRAWMSHEIVQQIEQGADPMTYAQWLAANPVQATAATLDRSGEL